MTPKITFREARALLTRSVMSESLAERWAVAAAMRADSNFFAGYTEDEAAILRGILGDLSSGTRELVILETTGPA